MHAIKENRNKFETIWENIKHFAAENDISQEP